MCIQILMSKITILCYLDYKFVKLMMLGPVPGTCPTNLQQMPQLWMHLPAAFDFLAQSGCGHIAIGGLFLLSKQLQKTTSQVFSYFMGVRGLWNASYDLVLTHGPLFNFLSSLDL